MGVLTGCVCVADVVAGEAVREQADVDEDADSVRLLLVAVLPTEEVWFAVGEPGRGAERRPH